MMSTSEKADEMWEAMNACLDEGDSDSYRWAFKRWSEEALQAGGEA